MFLQTSNNSFIETKQEKQEHFVCSLGIHVSLWPSCLSLSEAFFNVAFISVVMLIIVLGNLMVVLTVKFDSKLRIQRQNWLIVSLAVADFLVGLLVMPLTLLYEIIGVWILGGLLCELWLALDVLFATASILHICIISLDRYWSVTQPLTYPIKRTPTRICIMIGVAWLVSFLICFPPLLGWRPHRSPGECKVSSELDYVLYSSLGSFYIPIAVLVIVYWRIYEITKRHSQQRLKDTQRMDETLNQMTKKIIMKKII
ncbi:G_PROTEIN_RECEP_F1_2 domain-containing protein [Meloidogyne graminicola]|uniref:G_PROTEIN_RECEP_F1_2 domain-containing protein n=1 Tax=Meloidogyne graminicola TaxID=189291 RepID=A0A8T0A0G5_9BILA|nr:G_PROTEIN_RECEP_F1_2 domain-containing protein [Meloidogyne graminicola]